ncbi:hypothetical protein ESY86_00810 [Subsaximicrobium wynnwilliamsii]|uniref:Calcium-binding protein n=1 Tax=Subsaximicrobium wynnwilliamsii TaxID=291179 RepID=A0A5C6ZPA1_9FLAO|nr:hypothetical protein [Subsaximicrobium wynnwilliamsii]TXD85118.1 hypothetical protein ESY87_01980 [Subsaximicrobium wynnwilliamsii]TXD91161.1 hypothetical protein ESY86_00810 [Subsaximicrobium wynnwilliamsii]TXE04555.1 hypothetical protein ESY88_03460 [Subsaximicrobium wynnwilliamsii]
MPKVYVLFLLCLVLASCDDGDIIEAELDFDQELKRCGDDESETYVLYDTKLDPNESLTLKFPVAGNRVIFNPTSYGAIKEIEINGVNTSFSYRIYDGDPNNLICQVVPEPGTTIINDYKAAAGAKASFISTFVDDDMDGIPSELEGRGAQAADGSYPDAIDTDGDGLPDYQDADDDNDNVLTINEGVQITEDGQFGEVLDTDGDGTPNYLDNNDDGDLVLTKDEDENGNLTLSDDFDPESEMINVPRFLDDSATESFPQDNLRFTQYRRSVTVRVVILTPNIEILQLSTLIMGDYELNPPLMLPLEEE